MTRVSELRREVDGEERLTIVENVTDLVEIVELSLSQPRDIWGPTVLQEVLLE